jgi:hypothetical protein
MRGVISSTISVGPALNSLSMRSLPVGVGEQRKRGKGLNNMVRKPLIMGVRVQEAFMLLIFFFF